MSRTKVFISYSHRDAEWQRRVVTHLRVLESKGELEICEDTQIKPGEEWLARIDSELSEARVAVLLVSADFLTSDFIVKKEVPALLKRHREEGLEIIPVILRDCAWKQVDWLARMQVRPKGGRPLLTGGNIDKDCSELATELINIINGSAAASSLTEVPNIVLSRELFPRGLRLLEFWPDRRLVIGSIDQEEIWSFTNLRRLAFLLVGAWFISSLNGDLFVYLVVIGLTICLWYFIHRQGRTITINLVRNHYIINKPFFYGWPFSVKVSSVKDKDGKEWTTSLELEDVLVWRVRSKEPSTADRELAPFVSALRAIAARKRPPKDASGTRTPSAPVDQADGKSPAKEIGRSG